MPKRHNATGRSSTERFLALPYFLLRSPAWLSLSPVARAVFVEVAARYNGSNNGRIALSARDAAARVNCSKNTAARALIELVQKGFLEPCSRGRFDRKTPHATEYRVTLHACDLTGARASKRFMSWTQGPKSVAGPTGGTAGVTTGTVQGVAQESCRGLSLSRDRRAVSEPATGPTTGTHIIHQRGCGVERHEAGADAVVEPLSGGHHHAA
jgi:hypothetical protein